MAISEKIVVKLVRGLAGVPASQRRIIVSLGLTRVGSENSLPFVNSIIGQVNAVRHLISYQIVK
jgi:ribosomal protein L30